MTIENTEIRPSMENEPEKAETEAKREEPKKSWNRS